MARLFPRLLAGFIACFGLVSALSAQAQTPPSASAFQWEMRNVQISPDGNYISAIQAYQGRSALVVYPVGGGEPTVIEGGQRGRDENVEVSSHFWSGDRIVVTVNWNDFYQSRYINYRLEQTRLLSVRPDGRDVQVFFESRQGAASDASRESWIVDTLPDEEDYILVSIFEWVENTGFLTVSKVNIRTGRYTRVAQGTEDTAGWATDSNGNVVARVDYDDNNIRLLVREPGSHNWRTILTDNWFDEGGEGTLSPITVLDGGRTLYLRSNHEGRIGIYKYNLEGGGGLERVFLHDWVDAGSLNYSRDDDRATSVSYWVHTPRWLFLDEEEEADARRYVRLLYGDDAYFDMDDDALASVVAVTSETDDETKRILMTYGAGDPPVYYFMDDEARTINEIGQRYPDLSPGDLASVQVVEYTARDGTELFGYLALPPGRTIGDGPLPFVLWPHGGPNARDTATFDVIRQFLATRGYAVFAPQFRGSRGFGNDFLRAGFGEWGEAMQNDLTDATQAMIDMGVADPAHMCIVGWSYSAYAAMYAAVDTPDLYNCGVGINGVYDLPRMTGYLQARRAWSSIDFWAVSMGDDTEMLAHVSPNRRADDIGFPVLLIASEQDPVVPFEQTRMFLDTLRREGVPHESHIFEYGNHSMDYRPNMEETFRQLENFLARHM